MQNREGGHGIQGRDRSANHVFRSSMSDPVYFSRSSMSDPSYPGPQRGMVTPQVNVAEGTAPDGPTLLAGLSRLLPQLLHHASVCNFPCTSASDTSFPEPQRGVVTPQANVVEGTAH